MNRRLTVIAVAAAMLFASAAVWFLTRSDEPTETYRYELPEDIVALAAIRQNGNECRFHYITADGKTEMLTATWSDIKPMTMLDRLSAMNAPVSAIGNGASVGALLSQWIPYAAMLPVDLTPYEAMANIVTEEGKAVVTLKLSGESECIAKLNALVDNTLRQFAIFAPQFVSIDCSSHTVTVDVPQASRMLQEDEMDDIDGIASCIKTLVMTYDMQGCFVVTLEGDGDMNDVINLAIG